MVFVALLLLEGEVVEVLGLVDVLLVGLVLDDDDDEDELLLEELLLELELEQSLAARLLTVAAP